MLAYFLSLLSRIYSTKKAVSQVLYFVIFYFQFFFFGLVFRLFDFLLIYYS